MLEKEKISIVEEARYYHLKIWETPSFLFLLLGILTCSIVIITYFVAVRSLEPEVLILSVSITAIATLFIGGIIVKVLSRILILDRAKSEFISLASHQLRTPLSGVKWVLSMALSGEFGKLSKEMHKILKEGYESNERMILLVDDLLNVSRIESEKVAFAVERFSLKDLVKEVLEEKKYSAEEKRVNINFVERGGDLNVSADRTRLGFVLQNLIDNAIKYSFSDTTVRVTLWKEKGRIYCSVADEGMGIPERQIGNLFTKFFRADNVATSNLTGSGLGLYIVKSILDRSRGTISVDSKENEGSTFTFSLPVSRG